MTVGPFEANASLELPAPGRRGLLVDDLHDLLSEREALEDILPQRALANVGDEVLDDLEVDVCLEQRGR